MVAALFGSSRQLATGPAQRLKRVFHIDIETCRHCGGAVKIIACIEDPAVIETILTHLNKKSTGTEPTRAVCRADAVNKATDSFFLFSAKQPPFTM
jgi:hypothetical protein